MTHPYQAALQKMHDPLSLTEADFSLLASINPADEQRARDAVRQKQLELVTKAANAAPRETPSTAQMVAVIVDVLHTIKGRLDAIDTHEKGLTARLAAFEQLLHETRGAVQSLERTHTPGVDDASVPPDYIS